MGLPLIFDLRRGAMDDGPGIRTTVFLKGCPLSCVWCHNPESMRPERELLVDADLCLGCRACAAVCACGDAGESAGSALRPKRCRACGACADACPTGARAVAGKAYPVEELVEILLRDRAFYRATGGGVTFSGGEPTLHAGYLSRVLQSLKEAGIHTALQTCGLFDIGMFRCELLPLLDLVQFDLKLYDGASHLRYTGVDNRRILANFLDLAAEPGERLVARVPLVPGITATEENLVAIAAFLRTTRCRRYELLPYNPGAVGKRRRIGAAVPPELPVHLMAREEQSRLRALFQRHLEQ